MKEPTGDEEEPIRQYETAQAQHDIDYNPMPSTKRAAEFEKRKLCATLLFWLVEGRVSKHPDVI